MTVPTFTTDWVTGHTDKWLDVLAPFVGAPGVKMLEIGSWEGRSALWFLEHVLTGERSRLWCLDAWELGPTMEHVRRNFDANTEEARLAGRLFVVRDYSTVALTGASWPTFDAIYVDGDHSAAGVFADGANAWPLLKPGGVMIFDDYAHEGYETKNGIDAFLLLNAGAFELLHKGWQVIVAKLGEGVRARSCPMHGLMHVGGKPCGEL